MAIKQLKNQSFSDVSPKAFSRVNVSEGGYTLTVGDLKKRIIAESTGNLKIPDARTIFPVNWECEVFLKASSSTLTISAVNAATLLLAGGATYNKITLENGLVHIVHVGDNFWHITGNLATGA